MKPRIKLLIISLLISSTIFFRGCPIKGTSSGYFSVGFPFPFFDLWPFNNCYLLWPSIVVNALFYLLCIIFIISYKDKKLFNLNYIFISTIITVILHHLLWISFLFRIFRFYYNVFTTPIYLINSFIDLFHILHSNDMNISSRLYFVIMLLFFYFLIKVIYRIRMKRKQH